MIPWYHSNGVSTHVIVWPLPPSCLPKRNHKMRQKSPLKLPLITQKNTLFFTSFFFFCSFFFLIFPPPHLFYSACFDDLIDDRDCKITTTMKTKKGQKPRFYPPLKSTPLFFLFGSSYQSSSYTSVSAPFILLGLVLYT